MRVALRLLLAGVGAALLVGLCPQVAQAHARVVATTPADGQVLAVAPETLTVTFSEPVALAPAGNQVLAADGAEVEAVFAVRDRVLTITPAALATGTHLVAWRVVSADAHPVIGGFTFSVGARSATTPQLAIGAELREVRVARVVAGGLQYAGVLGLAGLVGFVVLVAPAAVRRHDAVRSAWRRAQLALAVPAVGGALLLVPLAALWEAGEPLSALLAADTWTAGMRGPTVVGSLVVVVGSAVSFVGLRRGADPVALGGAAAALAGLVVAGHTRSYGPAWLVLGADLVHLAAAAAWWGGLLALILALTVRPRLRATVRATLVARFSAVAGVLVAALVVAGAVLYWRIAHSVSGLWETPYGRAVLLKSGLVVPVLVLAGWNRLRLVPRVSAGSAALLTRVLRVEAGLLVAVVGVTGVLVSLTPPAPDVELTVAAAVEQVVELEVDDDHRASMVVAPARRGTNGVRFAVVGADGCPVELDDPPTLSFRLPGTDVGPLRRPVSPTASGVWEATVDLPLAGTWEVTLAVPLGRFEEPVVTGRIEVP